MYRRLKRKVVYIDNGVKSKERSLVNVMRKKRKRKALFLVVLVRILTSFMKNIMIKSSVLLKRTGK
jgi:hypothetical protein